MEVKKDIMWRMYLMYFLVCLFGIAVVAKVFALQLTTTEEEKVEAEQKTTRVHNIEAVRGNIYSDDGSLLATSIPIYEVRMDVYTQALTDTIWRQNVDSLAFCLSELYPDKTYGKWKNELIEARSEHKRYHLIRRKVKYDELQKIKKFPLLRRGQYKGGLIVVQETRREKPFKMLARRTIGYDRYKTDSIKPVGLEGAYRTELMGRDGSRVMRRISGNFWMPVNDANEEEPIDGSDIVTTININYQDVAETALEAQLKKHGADHGCVILMEVETGHVKAIANLTRNLEDSTYSERYNYAVGESTEPGSTFKLLTAMALFEDGVIKPVDSIETGRGKWDIYDHTLHDSKRGGYGKITVQRSFEVSSNIGFAKLVNKYYGNDQRKWTDKLYNFKLHQLLGLEIPGEGKPYFKVANAEGAAWSGISHTQMAIGYECQMTPFQTLAYYNAVANNGRMVKPMFVTQIRQGGRVVRDLETEVLNPSICSSQTIEWLRAMCEGVVTQGTGRGHVKSDKVSIAGKTGTARIANDKYGYNYGDDYSYQASFVGYFPADKPRYSCIVIVNAPTGESYYGSALAGPVFKEIAEKVYASDLAIHESVDAENDMALTNLPVSKHGNQNDLQLVFAELEVLFNPQDPGATWVSTSTHDDEVELSRLEVDDQLPDVTGMGLMDALYLLENRGKKVKVIGRGFVKSQRVDEQNPNIVILELS